VPVGSVEPDLGTSRDDDERQTIGVCLGQGEGDRAGAAEALRCALVCFGLVEEDGDCCRGVAFASTQDARCRAAGLHSETECFDQFPAAMDEKGSSVLTGSRPAGQRDDAGAQLVGGEQALVAQTWQL